MTSAKPNKLYIIRKVLMRAIQKCTFKKNLSHYVKSYGHLCQILAFFYDTRCPNMPCHVPKKQISKKIYFFLILHLILGKGAKFLVENSLLQKLSARNLTGGGGGKHPPVLFELKRGFFKTIKISEK